MENEHIPVSLLYPRGKNDGWKQLSDTAVHDLGLDALCENVTDKEQERAILLRTLSLMTDDPDTARYRCDVFRDIYGHPDMCEKLMKLLGRVDFLRDYGSFKERYDEHAGAWDLLHRLEEINDYIGYVEAIGKCLSDTVLRSEGLKNLKRFTEELYHDRGFEEMKKDIAECRATTSNLKSVTVGINLNERFEACSLGLISINSKPFVKSGILGSFSEKLLRDRINPDTEWNENYKVHPISFSDGVSALERAAAARLKANPMTASVASIPADDSSASVTSHMEKELNRILEHVIKKLREILHRYIYVTITDVTNLIPELVFYIRFAEYIRALKAKGFSFCMPEVLKEDRIMRARGIWNMKLAGMNAGDIVPNDLVFDRERRVYILTGANRGGKTTITQAAGQAFAMAQAGLYVPGDSFAFSPADCIYTHFPADEDKTLDLGRLGEECRRFREIYRACTKKSLLLLNETFSTTSFEEGYYIAKDSVKAVLVSGIRTIYNTHMHKLAFELDEINGDRADGAAASLIVKTDGARRSFRVEVAPPEGMSYARDIAEKYGVTYEMLVR